MHPNVTPQALAKSGREDSHQKALLCWAALNKSDYPELRWLYHVPNGGYRNKVEAVKFRAMGVKRGVPDLCLPIRRGEFPGLYIELKRPAKDQKKRGRTDDEQDEWITFLKSQGYGVIVCYGWEHARDTLVEYLAYGG